MILRHFTPLSIYIFFSFLGAWAQWRGQVTVAFKNCRRLFAVILEANHQPTAPCPSPSNRHNRSKKGSCGQLKHTLYNFIAFSHRGSSAVPVRRRQWGRSSAQISFSLCQWGLGAEEAHSLESYKKKVSEMLKEPAAGPGSHSQADRGTRAFSLTFQASASKAERFLNLSFYGSKPSSLIWVPGERGHWNCAQLPFRNFYFFAAYLRVFWVVSKDALPNLE